MPGAPGNVGGAIGAYSGFGPGGLVAGSPGYFSEDKVNDALFRYGQENTPRGQEIRQRIEELRQRLNLGTPRTPSAEAFTPNPYLATNTPLGQMAARFFPLSQEGRQGSPANFDNKSVY